MDKKHPILVYLDRTGEKQATFARRVPMSESYLSLILNGKRGVSLAAAARIEAATGGRVKAVDLARMEAAE